MSTQTFTTRTSGNVSFGEAVHITRETLTDGTVTYFAQCPNRPGLMAHGVTPDAAYESWCEARELRAQWEQGANYVQVVPNTFRYTDGTQEELIDLGFATGIEAAACELERMAADLWAIGVKATAVIYKDLAMHLRRQLTEMGR